MEPAASRLRPSSWVLRPRRIAVLIVAVWLLLYVCSFFAVRKQTNVTFFCDAREDRNGIYFRSVSLHYFSKEQRWNSVLYALYWPIHRFLVPHDDPNPRIKFCDEFPDAPIYLRDVRGLP